MKKQMIAALIATMLLTSCAAQGTQTDSAQTAEQATPPPRRSLLTKARCMK